MKSSKNILVKHCYSFIYVLYSFMFYYQLIQFLEWVKFAVKLVVLFYQANTGRLRSVLKMPGDACVRDHHT